MLKFHKKAYEQIRKHAEESYPCECCGVLLGTVEGDNRQVWSAIRCTNINVDSPRHRYHIEPLELIRIQRDARNTRLEIVGFYHSHPDHPSRWSQTDFDEAHWIGCSYVITAVEHGKAGMTDSFLLTGTIEADKAFVQEEVVIE